VRHDKIRGARLGIAIRSKVKMILIGYAICTWLKFRLPVAVAKSFSDWLRDVDTWTLTCGHNVFHWSITCRPIVLVLYCTVLRVLPGTCMYHSCYTIPCGVWYVMLPLTRMLHCVENIPCVSNWWRCHAANRNFSFLFEFIFGDEFPAENRKFVFRSKERFLNKFLEVSVEVL
jgi:hypothetical protein